MEAPSHVSWCKGCCESVQPSPCRYLAQVVILSVAAAYSDQMAFGDAVTNPS